MLKWLKKTVVGIVAITVFWFAHRLFETVVLRLAAKYTGLTILAVI